jgi:hypothetical protein
MFSKTATCLCAFSYGVLYVLVGKSLHDHLDKLMLETEKKSSKKFSAGNMNELLGPEQNYVIHPTFMN